MGKKYEHLSIEERTMIQLGFEQGCTWLAAIGLPPLMGGGAQARGNALQPVALGDRRTAVAHR